MNKTKQELWWDGLTEDVQDCINHSLFYKRVFNLDEAYNAFANLIH